MGDITVAKSFRLIYSNTHLNSRETVPLNCIVSPKWCLYLRTYSGDIDREEMECNVHVFLQQYLKITFISSSATSGWLSLAPQPPQDDFHYSSSATSGWLSLAPQPSFVPSFVPIFTCRVDVNFHKAFYLANINNNTKEGVTKFSWIFKMIFMKQKFL